MGEAKRPWLEEETRRKWSDEHLAYEVWMLKEVVLRMGELPPPTDPDPHASARNALVESFAVHVRCLREFLFRDRGEGRTDDAFASDFCDPAEWKIAREQIEHPEINRIENSRRIEKEIVHLTYTRSTVIPDDKSWNMEVAAGEFAELLTDFLKLVDSSFGSKARTRIEELASFLGDRAKPDDPRVARLFATTAISAATSSTYTTGGTIHPDPETFPMLPDPPEDQAKELPDDG